MLRSCSQKPEHLHNLSLANGLKGEQWERVCPHQLWVGKGGHLLDFSLFQMYIPWVAFAALHFIFIQHERKS